MAEPEVECLAMLQHWGICKAALCEAAPLGVRSAIIGTYRILLHRILNRGLQAEEDQEEAKTDQQHSRSKSEDRLSQARKSFSSISPLKHKLKLINSSAYTEENNKSRTCVII